MSQYSERVASCSKKRNTPATQPTNQNNSFSTWPARCQSVTCIHWSRRAASHRCVAGLEHLRQPLHLLARAAALGYDRLGLVGRADNLPAKKRSVYLVSRLNSHSASVWVSPAHRHKEKTVSSPSILSNRYYDILATEWGCGKDAFSHGTRMFIPWCSWLHSSSCPGAAP
jgi:hypothetical protein